MPVILLDKGFGLLDQRALTYKQRCALVECIRLDIQYVLLPVRSIASCLLGDE